MQSGNTKIVNNTIYLYIKVVLSGIIQLYSTRLILGSLGDVDYGIFGVVGGAVSMLGVLNAAMATATQRFLNYEEGQGNKNNVRIIFLNSVILHIVLAVIILLMMELFSFWLFEGIINIPTQRIQAAKLIYQFMAISTFMTIITVPYDALLNAHENMLYFSIFGIVDSILKLIIAFIIVYYEADKLVIYGLLSSLLTIFMLIIMRLYCHHHYEECKGNLISQFDGLIILKISKFAGWNFLGVSANIIGNYARGLMLNHFFGTVVIAAQSICGQISAQMMVFSTNMMKALNPAIVKNEGAGNRESMLTLSYSGCRFSFLLYSVFTIPFLMETEYILELWLGKIPQWTILFCQLQIVRVLLDQLTLPLMTSLQAVGKVQVINMFDFLLGLITFLLSYIMYSEGAQPYWHFILGILFLSICESVIKIGLCKRFCSLRLIEYLKFVIKPSTSCFLVSFVFVLPIKYLFQYGFLRFILMLFVFVIIYVCMVYTVGLNKKERSFIKKTFFYR